MSFRIAFIRRAILACAVLAPIQAAQAQKSADTMRVGMAGSLVTISTYFDATPASHLLSHALFDTLIAFDERTRKFQPLLVTAWRRIDDRTVEFDIRQDAKWHDGTKVDVYDVFYTYDWLSQPTTRLHNQYLWDWIDHAELMGGGRVRVVAKRPTPFDLARIAAAIPIMPEHKHGQMLEERPYFGRNPIGSGPYRFVSLGSGDAIVARTDAYHHGGAAKPVPGVGRFEVRAGWKYEERLAEWRNGRLDVLLDSDPRDSRQLAQARDANVATVAGYGMLTLAFNARAGARAVANTTIRRALMGSIDRAALAAMLPPGGRIPAALCWAEQAGCGAAQPFHPMDPHEARRHLAALDGGKPLVLLANGAAAEMAAERIAGTWRTLGVTVRIQPANQEETYISVRDNLFDAAIVPWHAGGLADAVDTISTFFAPGPWDLHTDPALHALAAAAQFASPDTQRREIVGRALELSARNAYAAPIAPLPDLVLHGTDVSIDTRGRFEPAGFSLLDLNWR